MVLQFEKKSSETLTCGRCKIYKRFYLDLFWNWQPSLFSNVHKTYFSKNIIYIFLVHHFVYALKEECQPVCSFSTRLTLEGNLAIITLEKNPYHDHILNFAKLNFNFNFSLSFELSLALFSNLPPNHVSTQRNLDCSKLIL